MTPATPLYSSNTPLSTPGGAWWQGIATTPVPPTPSQQPIAIPLLPPPPSQKTPATIPISALEFQPFNPTTLSNPPMQILTPTTSLPGQFPVTTSPHVQILATPTPLPPNLYANQQFYQSPKLQI